MPYKDPAVRKRYMREYLRKRMLAMGRMHRRFLNALKDAPCMDCGCEPQPHKVHWHHARGKKRFNIGQGGKNRVLRVLLAEIAKCDLLCAKCHVRRHRR